MATDFDLRQIPGNANTGIVRRSRVEAAPLAGFEEAAAGSFVQRALEHLAQSSDALGLVEGQPPEFSADPLVQETSAGSVAVHLRQEYKSIPIFEANQAVRFDPNGTLLDSAGTTVAVVDDLGITPTLSASAAVAVAAREVASTADGPPGVDAFGNALVATSVDLAGFVPKVIAQFDDIAQRPTVLDAGPFGEAIRASLVWFAVQDSVRLGWQILVSMPQLHGQWQAVIDAADGGLLLLRQLTRFVAASGDVMELTGDDSPELVSFPRALAEYQISPAPTLPASWSASGFPDDWVELDATAGNAASAHLEDDGVPVIGAMEEGRVVFRAPPPGPDQHVLNAFYHACYTHDFFYLLGFVERDGNFQQNNFGRGGVGSDRVDVRVYERPVFQTASMTFPADGRGAVLTLGSVTATNRNTALDASVIFHEYTHGVTNRLVGGAIDTNALTEPQSLAMGEGWGDYIACTLTGHTVIGEWVSGKPGGIRSAALDESYPGHYGLVGTDPYTNPHRIGEIWAATLLQGGRLLDRALGVGVGWKLGLQLIIDALKLSPSNPSFLEMRDAILSALEAKHSVGHLDDSDYASALGAMWSAFARFGMGAKAVSPSSQLSGIIADTSLPDGVASVEPPQTTPGAGHGAATPHATIPDKDPAGVTSQVVLGSAGKIKDISIDVDIRHPYVGDLEITIVGPDGTAAILREHDGLPGQNVQRTYTMADTPALQVLSGLSADGTWTLRVADLDRLSTGTLESWSISVVPEGTAAPGAGSIGGTAAPGAAIPDKDPAGLISVIAITAAEKIFGTTVEVDITHPWTGDLQIVLRAPDGRQVILLNHTGLPGKDLHTAFSSKNTATLGALTGLSTEGAWTLEVADLDRLSTGVLNSWSLSFEVAAH